jgi:hypothetical protein
VNGCTVGLWIAANEKGLALLGYLENVSPELQLNAFLKS